MTVTLLSNLVGDIGFQAGEVGLGDEVDDARNSIGTIGGGRTTGQHFDTLDQRERNIVKIEAAVQFGRNQTVAINQHDVAVRTQATQVNERCATIAVVDGRADAGNDTRNFAQNFFGGVVLLQFDLVGGGRRYRGRTYKVRIANQRTGNDDCVACIGFGGLRRFLCECGGCDQRRAQDRRCGAGTQKCPL